MSDRIKHEINKRIRKIQSMQAHKITNYFKIKKEKAKLQAYEEGTRTALTTDATNRGTSTNVVNKNNYKTYAKKVRTAVEMYDALIDYGGEICKGVVDTRVSFIAGEGLSVTSSKKAGQAFIDNFLKLNKLNGSRLLDMVLSGELEGRSLAVLDVAKHPIIKEEAYIRCRNYSWYKYDYTAHADPQDTNTAKYVTYREGKGKAGKPKTITMNTAVYTRLGGRQRDINEAYNRVHNILTDMENFSRAKYDLRNNTHLFGKYSPYFKTADLASAKAIKNDLEAGEWGPGTAYAGTGDFSIVEPAGTAADAIIKDMLQALKCVSLTMGIPVHFLAYPELMSNRATADNLMELVNASTRKDRLIWEEAFEEIIIKAMTLAVNEGLADNKILGGDIQVKLPMISIALLKQIIEIWHPLLGEEVISMFTFMNMLPGINPSAELKQIEKEKEEKGRNSPLQNKTVNNAIAQAREQGEPPNEGDDKPVQ